MLRIIYFIPVTVACTPRVLDEPEVVGGTSSQVAAALDEIAAFTSWIGADRIRIPQVRFTALDEPSLGRFTASTNTIAVNEEISAPLAVRYIVRHELCHALDSIENHSSNPLFGELGLVVEQSRQRYHDRPVKSREEAFAQVCDIAPHATHLLAVSCPADSADLATLTSWMLDAVWTESSGPEPIGLGTSIRFDIPSAPLFSDRWSDVRVAGTSDSETALVWLEAPSESASWFVNLKTGVVSSDHSAKPLGDPEVDEQTIAGPLSGELDTPRGRGEQLVAGWHIDLGILPLTGARTLAFDGVDWIPVQDGCLDSPRGVGFVGNRFWVGWLADDSVRLAPIEQ